MAATVTDLRIERKPKLSERVVVGAARAGARRRDRAGPEAADRKPAHRDLRRQPHRHPRGDRHARRRRAGRIAAGRRRLRASIIRRSAFGSISLEIGNKISHALNVLEVRMGIEIESAGLAALRRNSAAGGARSRRRSSSSSGCSISARRPARPTSPSTARSRSPPTIRSTSRCWTRSARAPFPATSPRPGAPTAC